MSTAPSSSTDPRKIELILAQLDSLPPLAPIVTRILELTEDTKTNAAQIVRLIESDPALTARVLTMLGRAELGVQRDAITVGNAVVMLGFEVIRQVALAVKVMEIFGAGGDVESTEGFDRLEFWKHCLGVACAAKRIAAKVARGVRPEEAFVFGLLHDIGKAAIQVTMPKSFARIIQKSTQTRADIVDVERAVLGVDHTVVGHRLAERWRLPRRLVDCMWLHHHAPEILPASVAAGRHVQIVQLADTLVREHRIGISGNLHVAISSRELAARLGLPEPERLAVIESLAEEIEARAAWIGAGRITSREVYLKALLRSTEELTAANAALHQQNQRLRRISDCFAALGWLNRAVSPQAAVHEVCALGAEALRRALSVPAVLVVAFDETDPVAPANGRYCDLGVSDGEPRGEILEWPSDSPDQSNDIAAAVRSAAAGSWLTTPGRSFDRVLDRYRNLFNPAATWLLPLVREQRWTGAAFLAADSADAPRLREESSALEALSAAVALALAQAQARSSALALSDELAEANRRWSAMQSELLRTRTLESIVGMAAGAAHELNNPLAVISGRAQMLLARASDVDTRQALETVVAQTQACSGIVTELMEFAQPPAPAPEAVDLGKFLDSLKAEWAAAGLLAASELVVDVPSDTPSVHFDPMQLAGVFRELVRNAVEAGEPSARRLSIKAAVDLTEEHVVVDVIDHGRGMTEEVRSRAIDPFFSHRPAGRGRGLGLARVLRWLQQNGGTMRIESEPEKGTQIELRLPTAGRAEPRP